MPWNHPLMRKRVLKPLETSEATFMDMGIL